MSDGWTLQHLLAEMAGRGDHPAVAWVRAGRLSTESYASLAAAAQRLARGLLALGLRPSEPVVILAPNSRDWIAVRLALGLVGALPVPLDDMGADDETAAQARQSGARWAFVSPKHAALLRSCLPSDHRLFLLGDDALEEGGEMSWRRLPATEAAPLPPVDPESPAVLVYTSGTTGAAKSFTLSYRNIWANVGAIAAEKVVSAEDRLLLPLPLHHIYPQVIGLLTPLTSGAIILLPEAATGPQIALALGLGKATGVVGVPRLYAALLDAVEARVRARGRIVAALFHAALGLAIAARRRLGVDLGRFLFRSVRARLSPQLRLLVSGGARIEPELLWRLVGLGFDLRSGYGLAETASTFTGNLPGRERLGSEGKPFQGGELRIAQPDETGYGEIELRGPSVFSAYRDNPAANREAFTADGWFRTGDLGRLDADGFLYVAGRMKELIVLGGGKKVDPERLEALYGASPFVREVAVLERSGALVALVHPDLEAIRSAGLTRVEDVLRIALQECAAELAPWERLAGFAVAAAPLPRTRLGKYRRFLLPPLYEAALAGQPRAAAPLSPADEALLAMPRARALWAFLRERYPNRLTDLDSSLALDVGLDSLEWMSLSLEIERRFAVSLPEEALAELDRVRDLIRRVGEWTGTEPAFDAAAEIGRWLRLPSLFGGVVAWLAHGANRALLKVGFRLRVSGLEHLPASGPFVIVANHCSDLDPLVVAAALPPRLRSQVHWGGETSRLFRTSFSRWLCRQLRIFPVDERRPGLTLTLASAVLERSEGLVWFPEAWRSPDGRLQRFLPGIGRLLAPGTVPAIPARLFGTFEAMPRTRRWPRLKPVLLRFGPPLAPRELERMGQGSDAESRIADGLHHAVERLEAPAG
ncbi:MAG: AMP-binding protein [Pseudomonadota bacterium]